MPKMPTMPTCTPTSCPKPHHGTPHAATSPPPRHHSSSNQGMRVVEKSGGAKRDGY